MVGGCLVFIKVRPKILLEILCEFQEHDLLRVIVGWLELVVHNGLDDAGVPLWFADIVRLFGDLRDGIRFDILKRQWCLSLTV